MTRVRLYKLRAPFGGVPNSGIGRESGDWSKDVYREVTNISILKGSFA